MKKTIILIIFILLFLESNNYKELNSLAIITNIGIEKTNNKYKVTFQEIIPVKEENKINKTYKYYTNTSNTIENAFNNLSEDITKEIYLEHLENIIIKDNNIKTLYNLDNFFKNDLDNFNIVLTETTPKKVLEYGNNYKYVNSIIKDNMTLKNIKKAKLEHKKIKVPIIKIDNNKLIFYKYKMIGDDKYE